MISCFCYLCETLWSNGYCKCSGWPKRRKMLSAVERFLKMTLTFFYLVSFQFLFLLNVGNGYCSGLELWPWTSSKWFHCSVLCVFLFCSFLELYGLHFTSESPVWMSWTCVPLASGFCCQENLPRMIFMLYMHCRYFLISAQKFFRCPFSLSVCRMALAHESFPFQGGTTAPEIPVRQNRRPNWTEKKVWSASIPQQFGEGTASDKQQFILILF